MIMRPDNRHPKGIETLDSSHLKCGAGAGKAAIPTGPTPRLRPLALSGLSIETNMVATTDTPDTSRPSGLSIEQLQLHQSPLMSDCKSVERKFAKHTCPDKHPKTCTHHCPYYCAP